MDGQINRAEERLRLMKAIEKFAESRKDQLTTPDGAYCMCDSTSDAFLRFAQKECGITLELSRYDFNLDTIEFIEADGRKTLSSRNPDPTLYQRGKHPVAEFHRAGWHAIVETPEFFLDFTARQYHQDACYPHIISKQLVGMSAPHIDADDTSADIIAAAAAAGGN